MTAEGSEPLKFNVLPILTIIHRDSGIGGDIRERHYCCSGELNRRIDI